MGQFLVNPSVPFETSPADEAKHAGARVARMILRSLGVAAPLAVDPMYSYAAARNDPGEGAFWYVDPLGMQHTLADFDPRPPGGFPGHWRIYTNTGQPMADNQIRSTLQTYNVAAACLVGGGKHWVCVVGYQFDDNTDKLTGFVINDPAYDGGGAQLGVSLAMWDDAYTPVTGGTKWLGRITEVGDPNPADELPPPAARRIVRPGDTLIPAEEATKLAVEGALEQFGELPNLRRALDVGKLGRPQLVARLDRRGQYYYLVPVTTGDAGSALAAIMLDARIGDVLSVSASEEPHALWPVDRERALKLATRAPIPVREPLDAAANRLLASLSRSSVSLDVADRGAIARAALASYAQVSDRLVLRAAELEPSPTWAWHPCGGLSPFHPFHVLRTPWSNVYVNARSGAVLTSFELCPWTLYGG